MTTARPDVQQQAGPCLHPVKCGGSSAGGGSLGLERGPLRLSGLPSRPAHLAGSVAQLPVGAP
jgi:hypothetical protein